jgi:hypothetical protein
MPATGGVRVLAVQPRSHAQSHGPRQLSVSVSFPAGLEWSRRVERG